MGCSTCSTNTGGEIAAGCQNHGHCSTGGCNKLNVYDWLADMILPDGMKSFNIVEVRFKGSRKEFFRNSENIPLKTGDVVAVEGSPGHDIGLVSLAGELVRIQMKLNQVEEDAPTIKALYRLARPADIEKWEAVKSKEVETMYRARSIALSLNLKMKLSDVEYQGDGKKATFFYTADERVDFRELIKKLAEHFHVRVEMRQIGMRQEASRLGGIGSCGRELCCSTWLTDFKMVTTGAARYQNLSLNPLKLAGQCGKLKCCLNYELDSYMDALKDIPDSNTRLETARGVAWHRKTDIFKRLMWFAYDNRESGDEAAASDQWVVLAVDRVKDIIALNKQGEKPADLSDYMEPDTFEKPVDYADVVGQDSLTRMMDKKKKKKKKKNKGGGSDRGSASSNQQTSKGPQEKPPLPRQQPRQHQQGQQSRQQQQGQQQRPQSQPGQQQQSQQSQRQPSQQQRPQRAQPPASSPSPSPSPVPSPPPAPPSSGEPKQRQRQIPPRTNPDNAS